MRLAFRWLMSLHTVPQQQCVACSWLCRRLRRCGGTFLHLLLLKVESCWVCPLIAECHVAQHPSV